MAFRLMSASFSPWTSHVGMNLFFPAAHLTRRPREGSYHPRVYLPAVHLRNNNATHPLASQPGCPGYQTLVGRATSDMSRCVTWGGTGRTWQLCGGMNGVGEISIY